MIFSNLVTASLTLLGTSAAFAPPPTRRFLQPQVPIATTPTYPRTTYLHQTETKTDEDRDDVRNLELTDDESKMVVSLWEQSNESEATLRDLLIQALPTLPPQLVVKLVQSQSVTEQPLQRVSLTLKAVMDENMAAAKEVLANLLEAGEIRKLDNEIGKACRAGKLDMAFFTVLNMNLEDARMQESEQEEDEGQSSRSSILQHIYTRCQEEVEKSVPPGVALLNKLMRTTQEPIRINQLQHYLCPQPDVIKLPDGQEIPVKESEQKKVLVPLTDFVEAVSSTVLQIRTMEQAGAVEREMSASMVEACRSIAKEARIVIGENYGKDSSELRSYEESLQPVFRPNSPESPYIQGEQ